MYPFMVKRNAYKMFVRPAMIYSAETWAVKKVQEKKLGVAEMRMLRWMNGGTKLDRIRNEIITGTARVEKYPRKCRKVGSSGMGMY